MRPAHYVYYPGDHIRANYLKDESAVIMNQGGYVKACSMMRGVGNPRIIPGVAELRSLVSEATLCVRHGNPDLTLTTSGPKFLFRPAMPALVNYCLAIHLPLYPELKVYRHLHIGCAR